MSGMIYVFSVILLSVYPGQLELVTESGAICITLHDEVEYLDEQGALKSQAVIENINARLTYLENVCLKKLEKDDYLVASLLLEETRFLLNLLPNNYFVVLTPHIPLAVTPISNVHFSELIVRLEREPFSENRLMIIRTIARSNFFLVGQVEELLDYFIFEDDRIEAVRLLYPTIADNENAYRLYDKFHFSSSKEELATILQ